MLKSEAFRSRFLAVDHISSTPIYLPNFTLAALGYNDRGQTGQRILFVGNPPVISAGIDTINTFLDVMDFDSNADRTNAVAAALTVLLRNHSPGGKPIILATATKSHAGKETILTFATGQHGSVSISYQAADWAVERSFVGAVTTNPDATVVVLENACAVGKGQIISSAFFERFATNSEPILFSTGTGPPLRVRNNYVLAISTNFGKIQGQPKSVAADSSPAPAGSGRRAKIADWQSQV